jgi:hypothetical protein
VYRHFEHYTRVRRQRELEYHAELRRKDQRYAFTLEKHEKDVFSARDVARRIARWSHCLKGN